MTIHEMFEDAFRGMHGKELCTYEIEKILKDKFPEIKIGSIRPNDHAEGNKSPCRCAASERRIFDRVMRGKYRVI